ncbi:UBX domain-containing protein 2B, partial [Galemys pyrenaicus]
SKGMWDCPSEKSHRAWTMTNLNHLSVGYRLNPSFVSSRDTSMEKINCKNQIEGFRGGQTLGRLTRELLSTPSSSENKLFDAIVPTDDSVPMTKIQNSSADEILLIKKKIHRGLSVWDSIVHFPFEFAFYSCSN